MMDDPWGESGICLVCYKRANARLRLELRLLGPIEGEEQGFCKEHMMAINRFIAEMMRDAAHGRGISDEVIDQAYKDADAEIEAEMSGDLTIVQVAEGEWGVQVGETVVRIHGPEVCHGERCPFHNPSPHHMRAWRMNVRMDRGALVERMCEHGVGHPDPDSVDYFERQGAEMVGVHGCDGCCGPPDTGGRDE